MPKSEQWRAWNDEREHYMEFGTQGYESDIQGLEAHIAQLLRVAPKDKAGWPNTNALDVINLLRQDLAMAKAFFGQMP